MDCLNVILRALIAFGTVGAFITGAVAIRKSTQNTNKQVTTHKLEELFEVVKTLGMYYGTFNKLFFVVKELENPNNTNIRSIKDYLNKRDQYLTQKDRDQIKNLLSRLEVLIKCYTTGQLKSDLLYYMDLMDSYFDLVENAQSIPYAIKWGNKGFPDLEEFQSLLESTKRFIISQIEINR